MKTTTSIPKACDVLFDGDKQWTRPKFWMVKSIGGPGNEGIGGPTTYIYETEASAVAEAERLATRNPRCLFAVLVSTRIVSGEVEVIHRKPLPSAKAVIGVKKTDPEMPF